MLKISKYICFVCFQVKSTMTLEKANTLRHQMLGTSGGKDSFCVREFFPVKIYELVQFIRSSGFGIMTLSQNLHTVGIINLTSESGIFFALLVKGIFYDHILWSFFIHQLHITFTISYTFLTDLCWQLAFIIIPCRDWNQGPSIETGTKQTAKQCATIFCQNLVLLNVGY